MIRMKVFQTRAQNPGQTDVCSRPIQKEKIYITYKSFKLCTFLVLPAIADLIVDILKDRDLLFSHQLAIVCTPARPLVGNNLNLCVFSKNTQSVLS